MFVTEDFGVTAGLQLAGWSSIKIDQKELPKLHPMRDGDTQAWVGFGLYAADKRELRRVWRGIETKFVESTKWKILSVMRSGWVKGCTWEKGIVSKNRKRYMQLEKGKTLNCP